MRFGMVSWWHSDVDELYSSFGSGGVMCYGIYDPSGSTTS